MIFQQTVWKYKSWEVDCLNSQICSKSFFLSGRLGQIGLKEGCLAAVKNISSVIGLFVQHAEEEGNVFLDKLECNIHNVALCNARI